MKRFERAFAVTALLATAVAIHGRVGARFDQRLAADKQAAHVLNRLTFGPKPGDAAEVARMGVERWIDLQLHPERIAENPRLETNLKPLGSLQLAPWQIAEKYAPSPEFVRANVTPQSLLPQPDLNRFMNGTPEDRRVVLASLNPDVRSQLLGIAPPQLLEGLSEEIRQAANRARQAQNDARQREIRRLMPPLEELLTPDQRRIVQNGTADAKLALINSFAAEKRQQVLRSAGPRPLAGLPAMRREAMALSQQPQQLVNAELIENKLYRALQSNRQLEEVLVDFWFNHFNVYNGKGQTRVLLTGYERDAIRPFVFGHFRDLLLATARHPAMLIYLDNAQSQAPRDDAAPPNNANVAPQRRPGLNENYGRELMELHTLGVDGGYTQQDVIAVARAFTGWTVYDPQRYAEFQFNPNVHDRKEKIVLGHTLPAGRGEQDGVDVIDILVHHPATAKFIAKKLAQRFVSDDPPQVLIDRMAATFAQTGGDLRAVLQTLFASTEFLSEGAWQAKLKSPLELVVSAARALNAEPVDTFVLAQRIADLGQPLYGKVEPAGYPNTGEGWASAAGILGRINFAAALASGQIPGLKADMSRFNFMRPAAVALELLDAAPSAAMLESIEKGIEGKEVTPTMLATVVLSSPEFQRR